MANDITCIYCGERPAKPGEHAVPAALGNFPPFDDRKPILCAADSAAGERGCNVTLGNQLYTPLFQQSGYSTMRRFVPWEIGGKRTRKGRVRGKRHRLGEVTSDGDAKGLLYDPSPGFTSGDLTRQIRFRDGSGEIKPWPLPDGLSSASDLERAVSRSPYSGDTPFSVIAHPEDELCEWVRELYPDLKITLSDLVEPGDKLDGMFGGEVTVLHVRGLAMMAFHMFLFLHDTRGDEANYEHFRRFIKTGESDQPFFSTAVLPKDKFPEGVFEDRCPGRIKHLYGDHVSENGNLIIDLCLFAGTPAPFRWWRFAVAFGLRQETPPSNVALVYHANNPIERDGQRTDGVPVNLVHQAERLVVPEPPPWTATVCK